MMTLDDKVAMRDLEELLRSNLEAELPTPTHLPKAIIINDVVDIMKRTITQWYDERHSSRKE